MTAVLSGRAPSRNSFEHFRQLVRTIKLNAKPFDINIFQVYFQTSDSRYEELDNFYSELETAFKQNKSSDNTITQGNFNAKVRKGITEDNVRAYRLGRRND